MDHQNVVKIVKTKICYLQIIAFKFDFIAKICVKSYKNLALICVIKHDFNILESYDTVLEENLNYFKFISIQIFPHSFHVYNLMEQRLFFCGMYNFESP